MSNFKLGLICGGIILLLLSKFVLVTLVLLGSITIIRLLW